MSARVFTTTSILLLCAGLLTSPYWVRAAGFRAESGTIAQVDLQRVYLASDARKAAQQHIRQYGQILFERYAATARLKYLNPDELTQYTQAVNAQNPTPEDKATVSRLEAESTRRMAEMQALSEKKQSDLTDADRKRIKELSDIQALQPQALETLRNIYQQMVTDEQDKATQQGLAEVRAIVRKVAKEHSITEVFDTSSLVVAPVDLTDEVLARATGKKR
ncbi:MAG: OmpH family outer membrane protein [Chthonomonadales bacterium]